MMQLPSWPQNRPERIIRAIIADAQAARSHVSLFEHSDPIDPKYDQMSERVEASHRLLAMRLKELEGVIISDPELEIWTSEGSFSSLFFELARRGIPRSDLDSRLNTSLFWGVASDSVSMEYSSDAGGSRYHYEFNLPVNVGKLASLPPLPAFCLLLEDILWSFEEWSNFATKHIFEREVLQKLYLLKLVRFVSGKGLDGGPAGGNIDPDSDGGAGVPRRPMPPHLVGGAENDIPEPEEVEVVYE